MPARCIQRLSWLGVQVNALDVAPELKGNSKRCQVFNGSNSPDVQLVQKSQKGSSKIKLRWKQSVLAWSSLSCVLEVNWAEWTYKWQTSNIAKMWNCYTGKKSLAAEADCIGMHTIYDKHAKATGKQSLLRQLCFAKTSCYSKFMLQHCWKSKQTWASLCHREKKIKAEKEVWAKSMAHCTWLCPAADAHGITLRVTTFNASSFRNFCFFQKRNKCSMLSHFILLNISAGCMWLRSYCLFRNCVCPSFCRLDTKDCNYWLSRWDSGKLLSQGTFVLWCFSKK